MNRATTRVAPTDRLGPRRHRSVVRLGIVGFALLWLVGSVRRRLMEVAARLRGRWLRIGGSGSITTFWTISRLALVLKGSEIKSIRDAKVDISNAYVRISDDEAWLVNAYIAPYEAAGVWTQHEPLRDRKLLLHRKEIEFLQRPSRAARISQSLFSGFTSFVGLLRWRFRWLGVRRMGIVENRFGVGIKSGIWRGLCGGRLVTCMDVQDGRECWILVNRMKVMECI